MLLASSPKVVADASGAVAVCINKINQQQQQWQRQQQSQKHWERQQKVDLTGLFS